MVLCYNQVLLYRPGGKTINGNKVLKTKYKVGDRVVRVRGVFKVAGIRKQKNFQGETLEYYILEPQFEQDRTNNITISIPTDNIGCKNLRKPISKNKISELLKTLSKGIEYDIPQDAQKLTAILLENDPDQTVEVVKALYREKVTSHNISRSKSTAYGIALKQLAEEIAYVKKMTPEEAEELIKKSIVP